MKKIINPYAGTSEDLGYNCFACAPGNPCGLKMEFYEDGEYVVCYWTANENYQSWLNTVHGGILATLIDETAGWFIFRKYQTSAMTTSLNVKYKKPVPIGKQLEVRAKLREARKSFLIMDITLSCDGVLCCSAEAVYYKFPKEMAEKEFHFLPYEVEE